MKLSLWPVILFFLSFLSITSWAVVPKTAVIKSETSSFILNVKYPTGFADKAVNDAVKAFITAKQKELGHPSNQNFPSEVPGKDSLNIDYKLMFQSKNALSILFTISVYSRGAAHPNSNVEALNFINGQRVNLAQLFKPNTPYLDKFASLSRAVLIKRKNNEDQKWLNTGTEPKPENYRNWYFTKNGLAIVFDTYQVAAYVYGPQTVKIAKSEFAEFLQPEVAKAVWGNS